MLKDHFYAILSYLWQFWNLNFRKNFYSKKPFFFTFFKNCKIFHLWVIFEGPYFFVIFGFFLQNYLGSQINVKLLPDSLRCYRTLLEMFLRTPKHCIDCAETHQIVRFRQHCRKMLLNFFFRQNGPDHKMYFTTRQYRLKL